MKGKKNMLYWVRRLSQLASGNLRLILSNLYIIIIYYTSMARRLVAVIAAYDAKKMWLHVAIFFFSTFVIPRRVAALERENRETITAHPLSVSRDGSLIGWNLYIYFQS